MLFWDIEATGLEDDAGIHCLVIYDESRDVWHELTRHDLEYGTDILMSGPNVAHNQIEYDQWVLRHHFPRFRPHEKSIDTLVMSRMLYTQKGFQHGLDPWGVRLGIQKPHIDDDAWATLSVEEALHRCREDVKITQALFHKLRERERELGGDWSTAYRIEHKVSEIHSRQHRRGVLVDMHRVEKNLHRCATVIKAIDDAVIPRLPRKIDKVQGRWPTAEREAKGEWKWEAKPFTSTGKLQHWVAKHWEGSDHEVCGPHTRIGFRDFKTNSDPEVKEHLLKLGWVPEEWNYSKTKFDEKGKPVRTGPKLSQTEQFLGLDESSYEAKLLARRVVVAHRESNVRGIQKRVREDGSIASGAVPQGTPTARYRHRGLVNIPGVGAYMGWWMRLMFVARPGYRMVGFDVDSCQLFALSARMNDPQYTDMVINGDSSKGTDQHTINAKVLTEAVGFEVPRKIAKNFQYAMLFGAAHKKLGLTLKDTQTPEKTGEKGLNAIFEKFPKLANLIRELEVTAKARKSIEGLDGRRILIEKMHTCLNYQLMSDESIWVKVFMCFMDNNIKDMDAHQVIQMHDELQFEVHESCLDEFMAIIPKAVDATNKFFDMEVPFRGSADVGQSWAHTH